MDFRGQMNSCCRRSRSSGTPRSPDTIRIRGWGSSPSKRAEDCRSTGVSRHRRDAPKACPDLLLRQGTSNPAKVWTVSHGPARHARHRRQPLSVTSRISARRKASTAALGRRVRIVSICVVGSRWDWGRSFSLPQQRPAVGTTVRADDCDPPAVLPPTVALSPPAPRAVSPSTSAPAASTSPTTLALALEVDLISKKSCRVPTIALSHRPVLPHCTSCFHDGERERERLIGNPNAPSVNALATEYGFATGSYAIGHRRCPTTRICSLAPITESTDDGTPSSESLPASAQTLVNQLERPGSPGRRTWSPCRRRDIPVETRRLRWSVLQHHNPFVYFPWSLRLRIRVERHPVHQHHERPQRVSTAGFRVVNPQWHRRHARRTDGCRWRREPSVETPGSELLSEVQSTAWYAQGGRSWSSGTRAWTPTARASAAPVRAAVDTSHHRRERRAQDHPQRTPSR